jgi:colicin import membrane protein
MGKVLVSLLMCCFLALDVFAQAPAAAPAQADPAAAPAKKTVARGRKAKPAEAKPVEAAATPAAPATAATPATPAAPAVHKDKKAPKEHKAHAPGTATPGTDKLIGKDAKGHDIYQGPKGGQYYISNGNKQYLDKKEKLKV